MQTAQLYKEVTQRIVDELERGVIPWTKPWTTRPGHHQGIMPQNAATGRSYHGVNVPILWGAAAAGGYATHAWLTYKQAAAMKGQVRRGEKGTTVVLTKRLTVKDKDTDEEKTIFMLRSFSVFNVAQIDGLPELPPIEELPPEARYAAVDTFIAATKADIRYGGDIACFVPSLNVINIPPRSSFKTPENYYATLLHELSHWSGHTTRLDRDLTGRFRTNSYAAEELVAEMGAAFLCAQLGIEGELRHAGYIKSWLELLKGDSRAIFTAASKASQAADYLLGFSQPVEEEEQIAA